MLNNFFKIIIISSIVLTISSCKTNKQAIYRVECESTITGYKSYGKWHSDPFLINEWVCYGNREYPSIKHKMVTKK
jgi:hypothetical protein